MVAERRGRWWRIHSTRLLPFGPLFSVLRFRSLVFGPSLKTGRQAKRISLGNFLLCRWAVHVPAGNLPRFEVPWAVAPRLTRRLPGTEGRSEGRTTAATHLSPVDWDMDSNQGFIPASGAWRGRDVVGRKRFKSQNPAEGVFSLCDSGLSTGPRSLGGVAAVL
jgi:hypothetical protein